MSEQDIQAEIVSWLASLPRVRVWRQNVVRRGHILSTRVGSPDITGIVAPRGRRLGVEVKTKWGKLSEAQVEFGAEMVFYGGLWVVARSLQEAQDLLGEGVL